MGAHMVIPSLQPSSARPQTLAAGILSGEGKPGPQLEHGWWGEGGWDQMVAPGIPILTVSLGLDKFLSGLESC